MELVSRLDSVNDVTSDQLRQYQATHAEGDYVIVDVREPEEYRAGHLPGARLMPLSELDAHGEELRGLGERTVVFYCRSGGRSTRASAWAKSTLGLPRIANLLGGYSGYQGVTLPEFPPLRLLDGAGSAQVQLLQALDLEKGTHRFYLAMVENFEPGPIPELFSRLATAELEHGRIVHGLWRRLGTDRGATEEFEATFAALSGRLIESGEALAAVVARAAALGNDGALGALELALEVELTAYDLYKNAAEISDDPAARAALLELAQQEKQHAQAILGALARMAPTTDAE